MLVFEPLNETAFVFSRLELAEHNILLVHFSKLKYSLLIVILTNILKQPSKETKINSNIRVLVIKNHLILHPLILYDTFTKSIYSTDNFYIVLIPKFYHLHSVNPVLHNPVATWAWCKKVLGCVGEASHRNNQAQWEAPQPVQTRKRSQKINREDV